MHFLVLQTLSKDYSQEVGKSEMTCHITSGKIHKSASRDLLGQLRYSPAPQE